MASNPGVMAKYDIVSDIQGNDVRAPWKKRERDSTIRRYEYEGQGQCFKKTRRQQSKQKGLSEVDRQEKKRQFDNWKKGDDLQWASSIEEIEVNKKGYNLINKTTYLLESVQDSGGGSRGAASVSPGVEQMDTSLSSLFSSSSSSSAARA